MTSELLRQKLDEAYPEKELLIGLKHGYNRINIHHSLWKPFIQSESRDYIIKSEFTNIFSKSNWSEASYLPNLETSQNPRQILRHTGMLTVLANHRVSQSHFKDLKMMVNVKFDRDMFTVEDFFENVFTLVIKPAPCVVKKQNIWQLPFRVHAINFLNEKIRYANEYMRVLTPIMYGEKSFKISDPTIWNELFKMGKVWSILFASNMAAKV